MAFWNLDVVHIANLRPIRHGERVVAPVAEVADSHGKATTVGAFCPEENRLFRAAARPPDTAQLEHPNWSGHGEESQRFVEFGDSRERPAPELGRCRTPRRPRRPAADR